MEKNTKSLKKIIKNRQAKSAAKSTRESSDDEKMETDEERYQSDEPDAEATTEEEEDEEEEEEEEEADSEDDEKEATSSQGTSVPLDLSLKREISFDGLKRNDDDDDDKKIKASPIFSKVDGLYYLDKRFPPLYKKYANKKNKAKKGDGITKTLDLSGSVEMRAPEPTPTRVAIDPKFAVRATTMVGRNRWGEGFYTSPVLLFCREYSNEMNFNSHCNLIHLDSIIDALKFIKQENAPFFDFLKKDKKVLNKVTKKPTIKKTKKTITKKITKA